MTEVSPKRPKSVCGTLQDKVRGIRAIGQEANTFPLCKTVPNGGKTVIALPGEVT